VHLHSLLTYSHANRAVLKLRDQKQLDFEELSDYLSGVTAERDRLAAVISGHAGSTGLGIGAYLKDRVDAIRGADDDRSRVEKMRKLDIKIKEVRGSAISMWMPYRDFLTIDCSSKTQLQPHTRRPMLLVMKPSESNPCFDLQRRPK
jgi:hypothetical protein